MFSVPQVLLLHCSFNKSGAWGMNHSKFSRVTCIASIRAGTWTRTHNLHSTNPALSCGTMQWARDLGIKKPGVQVLVAIRLWRTSKSLLSLCFLLHLKGVITPIFPLGKNEKAQVWVLVTSYEIWPDLRLLSCCPNPSVSQPKVITRLFWEKNPD